MSIIGAGDTGGGAADLPEIANSIRLNGTNNYLSRTFGTPTTQNTWTLSCWVKKPSVGSFFPILTSWAGVAGTYAGIWFIGDKLEMQYVAASVIYTQKRSASLYRDPSSHIHVTVNFNGSVIHIYAGDTEVTYELTTTYSNSVINCVGYSHWIGGFQAGGSYSNGYLSNICFIDGQALTPSSFAYTDPNGQWRSLTAAQIRANVGTWGANGFMLRFENGGSTGLMNLGRDTKTSDATTSGNNWTLMSMVRDGSVNDCWSYDTPTNNFATLNSLDISSGQAPTNGALIEVIPTVCGYGGASSSICVSSGKWFFETTYSAGSGNALGIGVIGGQVYNGSIYYSGVMYEGSLGHKAVNGSFSVYGSAYTINDVIGAALDIDGGTITFYKNGVSQGAITLPSLPSSGWKFSFTNGTSSGSQTFNSNFGQRPVSGGAWDTAAGGYFRYTPPAGFKALCAKNLSATGSVTTSGTFTGNAAADGPYVWLNGTPTTMTIDGNAVTWGTHADKLAGGFKVRTASSPYNDAASNSYTVTVNDGIFKYNNAEGNP